MEEETKKKSRRKSRTTRLEPGENSIERVTPWQDGGTWFIDWSLALHDGRLVRKRSQGATIQEARQRAHRKAKELLATGTQPKYKTTSKLTEYIKQVSAPAVESAHIRERSRDKYRLLLKYLAGECSKEGCTHKKSLKGHSIASAATSFSVLEACLYEIRDLHGYENGRQARTVLGRYVLQSLKRDGLIDRNVLQGEKLDLQPHPDDVDDSTKRGGKALLLAQYNAVLDYLLVVDPAEGVTVPKRGRWREAVFAVRQNLIDLALLQACTGLRVSEACGITWHQVRVDDDGLMHVMVTKQVSKTKIPREVPILMDKRVQERMMTRWNAAASDDEFVIGSPGDPMKPWDSSNRNKKVAGFYREISAAVGVELMENERTHMWRATLNTLLAPYVSKEIRAAYFGHDEDTNARHYTAGVDTSQMVDAGLKLRSA